MNNRLLIFVCAMLAACTSDGGKDTRADDTATPSPGDADRDGVTVDEGDCDDADPSRYPGAPELCNDVDDDCDGEIDEDASPVSYYYDADEDGHGDPAVSLLSCGAPAGYVEEGDDCDDTDATVHPGAPEVCSEEDEDCDGLVDMEDGDVTEVPRWYEDGDDDGYGASDSSVVSCTEPIGYSASAGDCDDTDAAISPSALEVCDDVDQDCDGEIDEDPEDGQTWYADEDGDGWGDETSTRNACTVPGGYVEERGDCDDGDEDVSPEAEEVCADGVDNDCDGEPGDCRAEGELDLDDEALGVLVGEGTTDYIGVAVLVMDIHGDGVDDLLAASQNEHEVGVFDPALDGELAYADREIGLSSDILSLTLGLRLTDAGDMDGDGYAELAVPDYAYNRTFVCATPVEDDRELADCEGLITDPDYVFGETGDAYRNTGVTVAAPGDADGDGLADLLVSAWTTYSTESILLVPGPATGEVDLGALDTRVDAQDDEYIGCCDMAVGDLDGDGLSEVALGGYPNTFATVYLYVMSLSSWEDTASTADATARVSDTGVGALGIGDLDGDGRPDLAVVGHRDHSVWLTPPEGLLDADEADWRVSSDRSGSSNVDVLADTDLDGDGRPDLILGESAEGYTEVARAVLWYGPLEGGTTDADDADLTLPSASRDYMGSRLVAAPDVTGDGVAELLVGEMGNDGGGASAGAIYLLSLGAL